VSIVEQNLGTICQAELAVAEVLALILIFLICLLALGLLEQLVQHLLADIVDLGLSHQRAQVGGHSLERTAQQPFQLRFNPSTGNKEKRVPSKEKKEKMILTERLQARCRDSDSRFETSKKTSSQARRELKLPTKIPVQSYIPSTAADTRKPRQMTIFT
jgi:hypothetical protein